MPTNSNPPLTINVRVFDIETDKEERKSQYRIKKVSVKLRDFHTLKDAEADRERQQNALDKKWKSLQNLIIWAMNNGKEVVFVSAADDDRDDSE